MATTTDQYYEEERIAAAKAERERFDALIGDLMKAVSHRAERNGRDARFVGGDCADLRIQAMLHALLDRLFYTGLLDEREYFKEASRHLAQLTNNVVQHSDANGAQPRPVLIALASNPAASCGQRPASAKSECPRAIVRALASGLLLGGFGGIWFGAVSGGGVAGAVVGFMLFGFLGALVGFVGALIVGLGTVVLSKLRVAPAPSASSERWLRRQWDSIFGCLMMVVAIVAFFVIYSLIWGPP